MIKKAIVVSLCIFAGAALWWLSTLVVSDDQSYCTAVEIKATPIIRDEGVIIEEVEFIQEAPLTDRQILARVVQSEAGGEPLVGKVAVAVTVLNRCNMWNKSVLDVVTQPNQYAYPYEGIVCNDSYKAVDLAYEAIEAEVFPSTMIYFRTNHYHEKYGEPYTQIGNHYFSTENE